MKYVRYYHYDEIRIPGSLASVKETFHHKKASLDAKVVTYEYMWIGLSPSMAR